MEKTIEAELLPGGILIHGRLRHNFVHIPDCLHDRHTLVEGDNRVMVLVLAHDFIRGDADNQLVAVLPRTAQQIEMPHVEHVEDTRCIADDHKEP